MVGLKRKNPVAKNLNKFNKPKQIQDKRKKIKEKEDEEYIREFWREYPL